MKNSILFSLITFFMVAMWIGFSIYHTHVSSTVKPDIARKVDPITPRFDTEMLDQLKTRKSVPVSLSTGIQLLDTPPSPGSPSAQKAIIQSSQQASGSASQL